eukprot:s2531_g20.t2
MDLSRKWAFLEANALAHHAHGKEPSERQKCLREAVSMYCRAVELLKTCRLPASAQARELGLHCRLNAACLALEAASIPTSGAQGRKQAQQAEKTSERLALEALELDPKNPHAAVLLARLSADQRAAAAPQWLAKAKSWATERNDQEAQKQVKCLESNLYPKPETWGKEPSDWVRLGVQILKQGKPAEAKNLFFKTIDFLDQQEGGPIERLLARPLRALAFDALEGVAESLAAMNDFVAALENGRRAASLLQPTRPGMQVPFPEPECSRREGLLNLSMGHAAEAIGAKDALRFFRLAAQALQRHGKDPALEGTAVLELGLRLVKECEEGDLESADLAVPALEHATSCLKTAQGRCPRRQSEAGQGSTEHVLQQLRWRELQAQVALCSVHQLRKDVADVQEVLDASKHLLPNENTETTALEWAELCGKWAFLAAKVGRLADAEEALMLKWKLAGGKEGEDATTRGMTHGEDKDLSPFQKRCAKLQQEALQSLALVKQKAQNPAGVKDVMSLLEQLPGTSETTQEMKRHLQRVAPSDEGKPSGNSKVVSDPIRMCTEWFTLHKGASLVVLAACLVSLLMNKVSWIWDLLQQTAT